MIAREDFEKMQQLLAERRAHFCAGEPREYPLSRMLYCGGCGTVYRRKSIHQNVFWVCRRHDAGAAGCPCRGIAQDGIYAAFIRLYNKLLQHDKTILHPLRSSLQELRIKACSGNRRVMDLHKEIASLREQIHVLARLKPKGFLDEAKFQEQTAVLHRKISQQQTQLKRLTRLDETDENLEEIDMLIDLLEKREQIMVDFEPEVFGSMVDKIIVKSRNELEFHIIGGLKLTEVISSRPS
jgi:hypothetical protein